MFCSVRCSVRCSMRCSMGIGQRWRPREITLRLLSGGPDPCDQVPHGFNTHLSFPRSPLLFFSCSRPCCSTPHHHSRASHKGPTALPIVPRSLLATCCYLVCVTVPALPPYPSFPLFPLAPPLPPVPQSARSLLY